jgi:hypothetical protein
MVHRGCSSMEERRSDSRLWEPLALFSRSRTPGNWPSPTSSCFKTDPSTGSSLDKLGMTLSDVEGSGSPRAQSRRDNRGEQVRLRSWTGARALSLTCFLSVDCHDITPAAARPVVCPVP